MIEDDATVAEMRNRVRPATQPRSFMSTTELRSLRVVSLRVPRHKLAEQLINPDTGRPVSQSSIANWEMGLRKVPLWVARRVRDLSEAARRYDAKRGEE